MYIMYQKLNKNEVNKSICKLRIALNQLRRKIKALHYFRFAIWHSFRVTDASKKYRNIPSLLSFKQQQDDLSFFLYKS